VLDRGALLPRIAARFSRRSSFRLVPRLSLGQEVGKLRMEHAELVGPRVAHDPEVEAAFFLVVPPCCAEFFEALDLGVHIVGLQVETAE
jgi:hypothetical protein